MNPAAGYIKLLVWSDEDQCFVGQCPGIVGPCCHGDDKAAVNAAFVEIVQEWIATMRREGKALPPPTVGRDVAETLREGALEWKPRM